MMNPYVTQLEILKKGREKMVQDSLGDEAPSLIDALYTTNGTEIHKLKMELYELEWIEFHWNLVIKEINEKIPLEQEKKRLLATFSNWIAELFNEDENTDFDVLIIEDKISILREIVSMNNNWEQSLKRMKVSFEKSKRQLEMKIKNMEE